MERRLYRQIEERLQRARTARTLERWRAELSALFPGDADARELEAMIDRRLATFPPPSTPQSRRPPRRRRPEL